ncbi:SGNH/GDSL hydrolase family protein [Sulfitobacter sp. R86518]|uniref:SGNH/GDSL hydrolase family protein n=1 Tax=Sulfitobacter sp. R86518 TaxID=3093858 RepID=UPI0036DCF206
MAENGVNTTNLLNAPVLDEVLGNRNKSTVSATVEALSQQMLGSGPLAQAISLAKEQTALDRLATGADVIQTGIDRAAAEAAKDATTLIAAVKGAYFDATIDAAKAEGVAALAVGDTFAASASDVDYVGLYLIETGPVATQISHIPTADALDSVLAAATATPVEVNYFIGNPANKAAIVENGYIAKADGTEAASTGWRRTGFIPVKPTDFIRTDASPLANATSAGCNLAFYDAAKVYLGFANVVSFEQVVLIAETYPTAQFIRAAGPTTEVFTLFVESQVVYGAIEGLAEVLAKVTSIDYFQDGVEEGYIHKDTGVLTVSSNWRTTGLIPVIQGQKFTYTGVGSAALVASVSKFDIDGNYLGALAASALITDATYTIFDSDVAFIRASAATTGDYSLFGSIFAKPADVSSFSPSEAYALKDEAIYLNARGIVADRAYDLAWNISEANERICKVLPTTTADIPVKLEVIGPDNRKQTAAQFLIKVADTPLNPSAARNVICFGDSLTEGVSQAGIEGAYVNELSRRLNGTGTALLSGAQSPAALDLSNMIFRGTRGDQAVLHEGRGGWDANRYLNSAGVGGVTNAFWNPAANGGTGGFDLAYYLAESGSDLTGDPTNGVNATGSNLTMIILLGWNDVYGDGAEQSAIDLSDLIDAIHATHPDTDIIVLGLNPAPQTNFKSFTGDRFVSERQVFETVVKQFGQAYKDVCASKTNTEFLQISHVFDAETAYSTTSRAVSARSANTLTGVSDYVHPAAVGYAYIADAVFYYLIHTYCQ